MNNFVDVKKVILRLIKNNNANNVKKNVKLVQILITVLYVIYQE